MVQIGIKSGAPRGSWPGSAGAIHCAAPEMPYCDDVRLVAPREHDEGSVVAAIPGQRIVITAEFAGAPTGRLLKGRYGRPPNSGGGERSSTSPRAPSSRSTS